MPSPISKIRDAQHRAEVVNLIASGMEAAEAMASVLKPADGKVKLGNGREVEVEAKAADESKLSDDEWLDTHCGEIRKVLPDVARAKFDRDAVFYRCIRDARNSFRSKTKKPCADFKSTAPRGAFLRAVFRVVNVAHPKGWLRCGECLGHGSKDGKKCGACYSDGYQIQMEGR